MLLGDSNAGRDHLVEQSGVLSLRQKTWKFIEPGPGPPRLKETDTETGRAPVPQLYRLSGDIGETRNLAASDAEKSGQLKERLNQIHSPY